MITDRYHTDFLVLTILPEEMNALNQYGFSQMIDVHGRSYYRASIMNNTMNRSIEIVHYTAGSPGNVLSGVLISSLLNLWNPTCVVVLGIAAGYKKNNANIGDILVGTDIIYYSLTKELTNGSEKRPRAIPADSILLSQLRGLSDSIIRVIHSELKKWSELLPQLKTLFGPLFSGESVMKSEAKSIELLTIQPKAVGLEMESYGVYQACNDYPSRLRVITIRSVSDLGDTEKNDDFHEIASGIAALFFLVFASNCDLDRFDKLLINDCFPQLDSKEVFGHFTENESNFHVDMNRDNKLITFEGVSPGVIFLPQEHGFWVLKEIHPDSNSRIQLGTNIDLNGFLKRTSIIGYAGLSITYVLLNPLYDIVASNIVYCKTLQSLIESLEIPISYQIHFDTHYNLLGLLGMEYRLPPAHVYLVGVYVRIGLARGGEISGEIRINQLIHSQY